MMLYVVSVIFILIHAQSIHAAPYHARNWQGRWANHHRTNATSFSRCGSLSSSVSVIPFVPSAVSSTFASPRSSTVDSAPTSSSEQGTSSTIVTSISVSSTASSEISSETSVSAQPVVLPETTTFSSGEVSATGLTSSTSDADKQAWLDGHNTLRQQHGASALTWSDTLTSAAQSWANGCVFEHSGGQYGENLYAGTGNVSPSNAVSAWAAEASDYDSSNPTYSHFTQMVWKSTTELGCALALCDGIFDASYGKASFYVCEYNPPGNVIGQFAENVQA